MEEGKKVVRVVLGLYHQGQRLTWLHSLQLWYVMVEWDERRPQKKERREEGNHRNIKEGKETKRETTYQ
jgi:hypothetical protein